MILLLSRAAKNQHLFSSKNSVNIHIFRTFTVHADKTFMFKSTINKAHAESICVDFFKELRLLRDNQACSLRGYAFRMDNCYTV